MKGGNRCGRQEFERVANQKSQRQSRRCRRAKLACALEAKLVRSWSSSLQDQTLPTSMTVSPDHVISAGDSGGPEHHVRHGPQVQRHLLSLVYPVIMLSYVAKPAAGVPNILHPLASSAQAARIRTHGGSQMGFVPLPGLLTRARGS